MYKCDFPAPPTVPDDFDEEEMGKLAVGRHTDAGAVTILLQDGVKGLQIKTKNCDGENGQWTSVRTNRGDIIINIGDIIQVMSNSKYIAPEHRVIASASSTRYSSPFFLNPASQTIFAPILGVGQSSQNALYHPIPWQEFRARRAAGDYKVETGVSQEVQITDWLIQ